MTRRIILIAAMASGALLLAGCAKLDNPAQEQNSICFQAGCSLLRDDATKGTTESFTSNEDTFSIFGERITSAEEHSLIFNGDVVKHRYNQGSMDTWTYNQVRYWSWSSQSDRYDFVAVSPALEETTNENAAGNLSVSTHYNYYVEGHPESGDQYDLLAATYRRNGSSWDRRYETVDLNFSHMGSAIGIKITNNSAVATISITSIHYQNLVVSADAKVSLDSYGRTLLRWVNATPRAAAVRQVSYSPAVSIAPGHSYPDAQPDYQIMIPQDLSLYGAKMVLNYQVGNENFSSEIPLANIQRDDETAISSWEIGYKYNYHIYLRMDGGLLVTVSTTPWDEPVAAETPGILI